MNQMLSAAFRAAGSFSIHSAQTKKHHLVQFARLQKRISPT